MVLEQSQILTTHNLAVLVDGLNPDRRAARTRAGARVAHVRLDRPQAGPACGPSARGISGGGDFGRFAAGHLRAAAARYPDDRATQELVGELLRRSPEFAALWPSPEVSDQRHLSKTIDHPQLGPIALTCDILVVPERDQHVVLFTAEPGTPAHEALRLLSVIGLQQMC
ncbi:hypothetical protein ALI22I_05595 [Saccharothrix sp. ALI-22-I]|nr:hypothetical protein ALI22I_05595 [Saccharothrix sp. ALI-22-I]